MKKKKENHVYTAKFKKRLEIQMEHTERCRYFAIYLKEYFMRYWNVLNWPVIKVQSQNASLVVECDFQQLHYPFLHPFVFHLAENNVP